jgi:hypothetical protein
LIEDDSEYEKCLQEAVDYKFPRQLRNLFVTLLVHCTPTAPERLWEKFKEDLSYDMKKNFGDRAHKMAYFHIVKKLVKQGKDLKKDFPTMPYIDLKDYDDVVKQIDCRKEASIADQMEKAMNKEQKEIYGKIKELISNDARTDRYLFVDGPGGTGKTYIYSTVIHGIHAELEL